MLKRILALLLIFLTVSTLCSCGTVTLHCDGCGKEVKCNKDMDEEWIIYCSDCEKEQGLDTIVE